VNPDFWASVAAARDQRCPCGRPLHYSDPTLRFRVEQLIAELGPTVTVTVNNRAWQVPRHYIALHGLIAAQLPALAARFGFTEVPP
jgi:hypothetical protein